MSDDAPKPIYGDNKGWAPFKPFTSRNVTNMNRLWFQFWLPKVYTEHLQVKTVNGQSYYRWVCPELGIEHSGDL